MYNQVQPGKGQPSTTTYNKVQDTKYNKVQDTKYNQV